MVCLVWGVTKSPAPSDVDLAGLRTDELELSGTMTEVIEPASTMAEVRDPAGTMKEEDVLAGTMTEELELGTTMTEVLETAGTITEGLEFASTVTTELGGEVDWVEVTEGMVETKFDIGLSLSGVTFSFCMAFFLSLDLFTLSLFCLRIFSS